MVGAIDSVDIGCAVVVAAESDDESSDVHATEPNKAIATTPTPATLTRTLILIAFTLFSSDEAAGFATTISDVHRTFVQVTPAAEEESPPEIDHAGLCETSVTARSC
ncbi:hypothetical protein ACWZHB_12215 [Nocardia sp. FBN12]|uniref:hypothetical protein n=1 Tax=Nocardia sp. FBN12 TaxID=3419766 RepID=UPI003CFFD6ED